MTVTVSLPIRLAAYRGAAAGTRRITSGQIEERTGILDSQCRRDLAGVDITGRRGVGYDSTVLREGLEEHMDKAREELEDLSRLMGLAYKGVTQGDERGL